jgi:zinc transport system ATP-binding protein
LHRRRQRRRQDVARALAARARCRTKGRISIHWAESRVIGYVPQTLDFDKSLPITVGDFMAMATQRRPVFLGVSKARRDEIDRTLERLGLNGKRKAKLGSLSGGERQRVLSRRR